MSLSGIYRHIDRLGRIVLPMELRRALGIADGDALMIAREGDHIILRKVERSCALCDSLDDLSPFRSKLVCRCCAAEIAERITQSRVATS